MDLLHDLAFMSVCWFNGIACAIVMTKADFRDGRDRGTMMFHCGLGFLVIQIGLVIFK